MRKEDVKGKLNIHFTKKPNGKLGIILRGGGKIQNATTRAFIEKESRRFVENADQNHLWNGQNQVDYLKQAARRMGLVVH